MMPYLLAAVEVSLTRYGVQTISTTTRRPTTPSTVSVVRVQSEPWRPDASPPRPEGVTADDTRVFVSPTEIRGASATGTAQASPPDRISWDGRTWRVVEVIRAPGLGPIPPMWHAYCVRVEPGVEP